MAKRPPSSWTIGRRSGGMTGITSSTMASGLLPVVRKALTTLRRFRALVLRCSEASLISSRSSLEMVSRSRGLQALLDGFGAHAAVEVIAVAVLHLAPQVHVVDHVAGLELLELVEDGVHTGDLVVVAGADGSHITLGTVTQLGAGCSPFGLAGLLKGGEILFDLLGAGFNVGVTALPRRLDLGIELVLQAGRSL